MPSVTGLAAEFESSVSANRKSLQANRKLKSAAVTSAFRLNGRTMEKKMRRRPAPSILAASRIETGIADMKARMMRMEKGIPKAASARISPGTVLRIPRVL